MSGFVTLVVLILVFLVMGWMTTPQGDPNNRWRRTVMFLGAVGLGTVLVIGGFVVLLAVLLVVGLLNAWFGFDPGLFTGIFIMVLVGGVLLFSAFLPLLRRMRISLQVLTIVEYYIQWMLIYVTIYQVAIDQLKGLGNILGDAEFKGELTGYLSNVLDPAFLVVLLLPVLISVWVTVAMAKLRIEAEHGADATEKVTFKRSVRRGDRRAVTAVGAPSRTEEQASGELADDEASDDTLAAKSSIERADASDED